MKKVLSIVLFVICGGAFLLLAMGSVFDTDTSKYDTSKEYSVGDTLTCPSFDIKVEKIEFKQKGTMVDGNKLIEDPEWIGVTLTVTNTTKKKQKFYSSDTRLINTSGEELKHAQRTYKIWGSELLNNPDLKKEESKTGYIQFINNSLDNSNLILKVNCSTGFLSSKIVYDVNVSE